MTRKEVIENAAYGAVNGGSKKVKGMFGAYSIVEEISSDKYLIRMNGSEFIYRDDIKQIVLKELSFLLTIDIMTDIVIPFMEKFESLV